jgi:hypothetical protein
MDIEISPSARGQRNNAAARDDIGPAPCEGRMNGKRLRSMNHPAMLYGERAGRTLMERAMGVLWRHSSVNLVDLASRRTGRGMESRLIAEDQSGGSIATAPPQPLRRVN